MIERRADDPEESAFRLRYKETSLSIRGIGVFLALAVTCIIGSNFYVGYRLEQALVVMGLQFGTEHRAIQMGQDRTACQVSLTIEERKMFRETYTPGSFRKWCPWSSE